MPRIAFAVIASGLLLAQSASAKVDIHSDGQGYTYKSPSGDTTYAFRFDTGAQYILHGDVATYSDKTGTQGTSYYVSHGRYDRFSNYGQGWTGSGYTPYSSPGLTTYRRMSSGIGLLGGKAGPSGLGSQYAMPSSPSHTTGGETGSGSKTTTWVPWLAGVGVAVYFLTRQSASQK